MAESELAYLRRNLVIGGENFLQVWNTLSAKDKEDLRAWAKLEMAMPGTAIAP